MTVFLRSGVSFLAFALAGLMCSAQADDLKFAPIFSDGVVIQRNQKVPVWGQGTPKAAVSVELGSQHGSGIVGADGWWRIDLDPVPVGGPYTLKATSGDKSATVQNVLSGDVWLCAGQSNMQMVLREAIGGERAIEKAAKYPNLRLLNQGRGGAPTPQRTFQACYGGKWEAATPKSAGDFSAAAMFFGLALLEDPSMKNVPVGLINSCFGGTAAEAWTPKEELAWMKPEQQSPSMVQIQPSTFFNAMISPLAPCGLSGVLWYQGEANAGKPELYEHVLTSLINGWRRTWNRPDLPFLIVQLPPYYGGFGGHFFTWVREAQAMVAQKVPHVSLVVAIDTTDGSDLHPRQKQEIGRRAALLARRDVYQEDIPARGPQFKSIRIDGPRVRVAFDTAGRGLASKSGSELRGFELAGADGVSYFADAEIDGDTVILESKRVPSPKTVRYAWAGVPVADLINRDGLPAAPFRTDKLPPVDVEFQPMAILRKIAVKGIQLVVDGKGKVVSLGVGGQEFLSNSLGGSGGTSFPSATGFQDLPAMEQITPNRILFSNPSLSLEIMCEDEKTEWTLKNTGNSEVKFRIMLTGAAKATQQAGAVLLERFYTHAKIEGAGTLEAPGTDGQALLTTIKPQSTVVLKITHEK